MANEFNEARWNTDDGVFTLHMRQGSPLGDFYECQSYALEYMDIWYPEDHTALSLTKWMIEKLEGAIGDAADPDAIRKIIADLNSVLPFLTLWQIEDEMQQVAHRVQSQLNRIESLAKNASTQLHIHVKNPLRYMAMVKNEATHPDIVQRNIELRSIVSQCLQALNRARPYAKDGLILSGIDEAIEAANAALGKD